MGNTNTRKIKHFLVGLTWKRKKTGQKYKKAIDRYIDLLKKEEKQGKTKWIYKTEEQALGRLKKYGITMNQVKVVLERRGLKDLEKLMATR